MLKFHLEDDTENGNQCGVKSIEVGNSVNNSFPIPTPRDARQDVHVHAKSVLLERSVQSQELSA